MLRLVVLPLLLALANCQTLRIYQASVPGRMSNWQPGPLLQSESTLCPKHIPSPLTVVCLPGADKHVKSASFYIDGDFERTERVMPYTLKGDTFKAGARPWITRARVTKVSCVLSNGDSVASTITFACPDPSGPRSDVAPTTVPPTTTAASTTTVPPPTTAAATTTVPPTTTAATSSTAYDTATASSSSSCIYIDATKYMEKTGAWELVSNGMAYKRNNPSTGIDKPGVATLRYAFTPTESKRYTLTVDMTTDHGTEHNDVWVEIANVPFTLVQGSKTRPGAAGMNKAYHNKNGRSKTVYTVDFDGHVFSTRDALEAGKRYEVKVGGRSTKVVLHGVILFPCSDFSCAHGGKWNAALNSCPSN